MFRPVLALLGDLDPEHLLATFGTLGLFLIVFAESGLLIGFFLPGDSLLFTAGLLSSQGKLAPLPVLLAGCFAAAVVGDQVGYAFGRRVGPSLFKREDSRIFKQEYIEKSQEFFAEHGSKTILLARFVPVVRTFAPIVAGAGKMHYRTFLRLQPRRRVPLGRRGDLAGLHPRRVGPEHRQVPAAGDRGDHHRLGRPGGVGDPQGPKGGRHGRGGRRRRRPGVRRAPLRTA